MLLKKAINFYQILDLILSLINFLQNLMEEIAYFLNHLM